MTKMVSTREIAGKKIVRVECADTYRDKHHPWTVHMNPRIYLDDGSFLYFTTEETETGEYGTFIGRAIPMKRHP